MSLNIQSMLDILKRQALYTIMGNINVTHYYLKEELNRYVNTGNTLFTSLLNKMNFNVDLISSSQTNATYLLAYLDFFALYTILYANYPVFASLSDVSMKKYIYINSIYKDLIVMIKEKETSSDNAKSLYINFLNAKNINFAESRLNSRENNNPDNLNTEILTLPIKSTKVIKPSSVIVSDFDMANHSVVNNSTGDEAIYRIDRYQNSRIGIVKSVYAGKTTTAYQVTPEITGTIYGYFSDRIFIEVDDIERDVNYSITGIYIKASSNGNTWSDPYKILPSVSSEIKIESNINIGLSIVLYDKHPVLNQHLGLTIGDAWNVDITSIAIKDPRIKCSAKFESMDFVSYIKYEDSSTFPLSDFDVKYKRRKYDTLKDTEKIFDRKIRTVIPVSDQVAELSIEATQKDSYVNQIEEALTYAYEFNLSDISLVANEYKRSGSITFNGIEVENISMISVDSDYYIYKEGNFDSNTTDQRSFIEYNVVIQNGNDSVSLPIVTKYASDTVYEYVVPFEVNGNVAKFQTRLPSETSGYTVFDLASGDKITVTYSNGVFTIPSYNSQHGYAIKYKYKSILFNDFDNTASWTKNAGVLKPILYGYYRDTFGHNYILVRQETKDKLFSGTVKSFIEMRSTELPYISPMIFDYEVMCN